MDMRVALGDDTGCGTADLPVVVFGLPANIPIGAWAELYEKLAHVHLADGRCAKNRFAPSRCSAPSPPPIEDPVALKEWLDAP